MKIFLQNNNKGQLQTRLDQEKAACQGQCATAEPAAAAQAHGNCPDHQPLFKNNTRPPRGGRFQVDVLGEWVRP